jgi:cytochrome c551/c552
MRSRLATGRLTRAPLACATALLLCGCGAGAGGAGARTSAGPVPSYVIAPFTHQERLVQRGAGLFLADGCSACHAIAGRAGLGPSFARFAGSRVTLAGGRRALVDEALLRRALLEPASVALKGYPLAPMLAAVARLRFAAHRADVNALAAFIEQIGPED